MAQGCEHTGFVPLQREFITVPNFVTRGTAPPNKPKGVTARLWLCVTNALPNSGGATLPDRPANGIRDHRFVADRLTVTIADDGVPFNPLSVKKPDTESSLEDREFGGLGIHLVRSLVDDVSYHRRIDKNVLTLMKRVDPDNV